MTALTDYIAPCFRHKLMVPFLECPVPRCEGRWRVSHVKNGQTYYWSCQTCQKEFQIRYINDYFEIEDTGKKATPVTVELVYDGNSPLTVRLNTWKYAHHHAHPENDFFESQKFFYEMNTCPTNWTREIVQLEVEGDKDPHGAFRLVSIVDGHLGED